MMTRLLTSLILAAALAPALAAQTPPARIGISSPAETPVHRRAILLCMGVVIAVGAIGSRRGFLPR